MAYEREREPSIATLLSGIISDAQELVRKEIALARLEIREEISNAKSAGISLAIAGLVLALGGLFLLVTLALGLADLLDLPTWVGFGIVGLVLAIAGYVLLSGAQKRLRQINPVLQNTVETMQENAEWIRKRTTSDRI